MRTVNAVSPLIMAARKKLSREERLQKKREAERLRYQRIKNDPEKYAQQKDKERKKYEIKKEKGTIKTVNKMTPREHRKARKLWREKAAKRRRRLAFKNPSIAPITPPSSDDEAPRPALIPLNENIDNRAEAAKQRSIRARKARNLLIKKQADEIAKLKSTVRRYKKRQQRTRQVESQPEEPTPNTKVNQLIETPSARETIKKKLLFSEVLSEQLQENFSNLSTKKDKRVFKRMISGRLVNKYGVLETQMKIKPLKKPKQKLILIDPKRKVRTYTTIVQKRVEDFMEDDSNSRMCAGKKDFVSKKGERKQKRVMTDTLQNLCKLFVKKTGIRISYPLFCRFRPFWVVHPRCDKRDTCLCVPHSNIDLILTSLHQAKIVSVVNHVGLLNAICCNRYDENCLIRQCQTCKNKTLHYKEFDNCGLLLYKKWQSQRQDYVDPKTKKTRKVTKCIKSTLKIHPRDLILELESKLEHFLHHERNIVHQQKALKSKKETLTEKDAIIHVDFSENYQTKYAEEVQSFHFGGSRQQISMHTVVVYTRELGGEVKNTCFCTISENLSHSPPSIWAHLQPILDSLPNEVVNLHFWSDGPVTQYRNKIMFMVLATMLREFYPNMVYFTWNYHEAGHGKGAPDGVGAACKSAADRAVANGTDISTLEDLLNVLQKGCPNIKVLIIDSARISEKEEQLGSGENIKTFSGTLRVHQVAGSVFRLNRITMKSLSCFCDLDLCNHFVIGTSEYAAVSQISRLRVEDVYGSDSHSDDELLSSLAFRQNLEKFHENPPNSETISCSETEQGDDHDQQPTTSGRKVLSNGDFVLVKLIHRKTEYRYVAMCTGVEEDDEIQVIFCKICDNTGKNFKIDDNDIAFIQWDQIIEDLPVPNIKMKGQRMFYSFHDSINVFEQN